MLRLHSGANRAAPSEARSGSDRRKHLVRTQLTPRESLLPAVGGEAIQILAVRLQSILPGIEAAECLLALQFVPPPDEQRPVGVVPPRPRELARTLEDVEQRRGQLGITLRGLRLECDHMHD